MGGGSLEGRTVCLAVERERQGMVREDHWQSGIYTRYGSSRLQSQLLRRQRWEGLWLKIVPGKKLTRPHLNQ
jgi:hypothetical protein